MYVELFTLCDAANESHGKVNLLGVFDTMHATATPVVHPACAIVVKVRYNRADAGNHELRLTIMDADGNALIPPFQAAVTVRFTDDEEPYQAPNLIVSLHNLQLPAFGEYAVDLEIDGRQRAQLPFFVRPLPQPPQP